MQSFSEKQLIDTIIHDFTSESSTQHIKSYIQHLHFSKSIEPHIAIKHIRELFLANKIPLTYQNLLQKRPKHQALSKHIVLSESTIKILSDAMGYTPECFSSNLSSEVSSNNPWESFRKLVSYYCNCIKIEEGATAYSFQNQLNEEFIYLQEHGHWFPKANGSWQRFIPLSGDAQIRNLWKEGESNRLILGYPVNATCKEDANSWVCAITPIFCYQLDHRITAKGLEITWNGTSPYINLGWLDHAFGKSASARKQFLKVCGLYTPNVAEGLDVKAQFPVRNRRLDLALILPEAKCKMDIEVDGDCHRNPDGSRKSDDYWRDIEMQAQGWQVRRFWTYQLREDMNACVKRVKTEWNDMVQKAIHALQ